MGLPMLLANGHGQLGVGLIMALGALSATRSPAQGSIPERCRFATSIFLPTSLAAGVAALLTSAGGSGGCLIIAVATLAALLMRFSRSYAVASVRFILFLVIFSTAIGSSPMPWRLAGLVVLGALWTALLVFATSFFSTATTKDEAKPPEPSSRARIQRLRRGLGIASTWDYPMRLALGLGLSLAIRRYCPSHHYSWISIAVALLTPRQFEMWPVKATQRFIGTVLGVMAAGAMLAWDAHSSTVMIAVTLLAALRNWYEERSYLLYSAVSAPLILCLMGAGQMAAQALLVDRVVATWAGVLIVLFSNSIASISTAKSGPPSLNYPGRSTDRSAK
jgi:hypothetical protein